MACVRGCCESQRDHYRGIRLAGAPSAKALEVRREDADLDAYRRLRKAGEQPPTFVGAAALEKQAGSSHEITTGYAIRNDRLRREVETRFAESAAPASTPLESA